MLPEYVWRWWALLVALAVLYVLARWLIGRWARIRRTKHTPFTAERGLHAAVGVFVRPGRRTRTRGDGVSLEGTGFDEL